MSSDPTPGIPPAEQPSAPVAAAPAKRSSRLGLVVFGATLFAAIMVTAWYWDEIAYQFAPRPSPEVVYGSWELDREACRRMVSDPTGEAVDAVSALQSAQVKRMEEAYGGMVVTFQAAAVTVAQAGAAGVPTPCSYEAYPSNVLVVQTGAGNPDGAMHLAIDLQRKNLIYWSIGDTTVPLKRKP